MSKQAAQQEAIRQAIEKLQGVELAARCAQLKLPQPENGILKFRAFAINFELNTETFELFKKPSGDLAKESDRILILHLLLCEQPLKPSDELITFRDFPGGMFYLEPFLSRTVRPLVKRYGNDLDKLKETLSYLDFEELELGDFSARIHCFGCIYITLIYRLGDSEFPAEAELLFNRPAPRALSAEDAVVMAARTCFRLF
jgi:hypothetical protein